ncbi:hypothetical protein FRC11_009488 [Ceratobasidium sp. 423]|nr:hypothetical protein FRC11_009488 [Ceratobasidium sp. 423]
MDAVRVSDGKRVVIKAFDTQITPNELHVLQYLSAETIQSDPRNHCSCALDSFPVPNDDGWIFVVMDTYHSIFVVPFETIGEVVELTRQLLEGLAFMHSLNIAHRDCASTNIMMKADPLFKSTPHSHPNYSFLTEDGRSYVGLHPRRGRNVKYYFIDFGLATLFPNFAERTLVVGAEGRERSVPELLAPDTPYDPFKVDIFIIGQFLWRDFYEKSSRSLYFLEPLVKRLIDVDPSRRPTADKAFADFELVRETLEPRILARALNPNIFQRSFKIMDAVRVRDGERVIIKAFDAQITPNELRILQYLSSGDIQSNPRNHCACALDSFPVPGKDGWVFVVMDAYHPLFITPFETIGEVVELIRQLFEGLVFMHGLNLAHRDCASTNIMMKADPLFKNTPHPHPSYAFLTEDRRHYVKLHPRQGRDVKYYFIDFGLSTLFPSSTERMLVVGEEGRERDVPEFSTPDIPYDPFKVDVCIIGRFLWRDFYTKSSRSLYFLEPLVKRLIDVDPSRRPTADEAFADFELIRETLEPRILARALNPNIFQRVIVLYSGNNQKGYPYLEAPPF